LEDHLAEFVHIVLPTGWAVDALPEGRAYCRLDALASCGGNVRAVPLTVLLTVHPLAGESADGVIRGLFASRVKQGAPEGFSASIGSRPARGFFWTDGIAEVASLFVVVGASALVEMQVARLLLPEPGGAYATEPLLQAALP
jgi:hypothetical protein